MGFSQTCFAGRRTSLDQIENAVGIPDISDFIFGRLHQKQIRKNGKTPHKASDVRPTHQVSSTTRVKDSETNRGRTLLRVAHKRGESSGCTRTARAAARTASSNLWSTSVH